MAFDANHPLSTTEAAALDAAPTLVRKAVAAIEPVIGPLRTAWPSAGWPSGAALQRQMLGRWPEGEGLTCEQRVDEGLGMALGLRGVDGAGVRCALWVWAKPQRERAALLERAARLSAADWQVSAAPGEWESIAAETDASAMAPSAIKAWLLQRIGELEDAGVLRALVEAAL